MCELCHPCLVDENLLSFWAADSQRSGGKQSTNPADNYHLARRRTLQVVVSSLLTEAGFESAEKASVETLTEMLQSCKYQEQQAFFKSTKHQCRVLHCDRVREDLRKRT